MGMYETFLNLKIPELKLCPFCKKPGRMMMSTISGYRGNYQYYAGCDNKQCKIKPSSHRWDDIYRTPEEAVNKAAKEWNHRG